MPVALDLTGHVYGRLTVIGPAPSTGKSRLWACRCECGADKTVPRAHLRKGLTASCGCLKRDMMIARNHKHGHATKHAESRTYVAWQSMRLRCTSPRRREWKYYGGRGITVCERWSTFENFLADMGECPDGLTLDRIDSDGDYEPGNCRWVSWAVQKRNRRSVKLTDDIVAEIHGRVEHGEPKASVVRRIRARIGLSESAVYGVLRGATWKAPCPVS